jgi:antitoxin ParD1/3/4
MEPEDSTMTLSFPPDLEQFVQGELASGRYESVDAVVCEGLRLLQERERRLEALRQDIDAGLDQVNRGEVIELEDEEAQRAFFEDIKTRGRQRRNAKQPGK